VEKPHFSVGNHYFSVEKYGQSVENFHKYKYSVEKLPTYPQSFPQGKTAVKLYLWRSPFFSTLSTAPTTTIT
jgi:hypothetical protein